MAERSNFQEGIVRRYYEHFDTISIQKLSEIVSEIYLAEANKPVKLWEKARNLLSRVAAEDERVKEIVAKKDIKGLARLVNELNLGHKGKKTEVKDRPGSAVDRTQPIAAAADAPSAAMSPAMMPGPLDPDVLKRALKAFRKRMKLTRLDDESKLGRVGNPMSGGKKSQVAAIMAPREFPKTVWDELVRQGKLRTTDGVFYELAEG